MSGLVLFHPQLAPGAVPQFSNEKRPGQPASSLPPTQSTRKSQSLDSGTHVPSPQLNCTAGSHGGEELVLVLGLAVVLNTEICIANTCW